MAQLHERFSPIFRACPGSLPLSARLDYAPRSLPLSRIVLPPSPSLLSPSIHPSMRARDEKCFLAFFRRQVVASRVRRGTETEKVIHVRAGDTFIAPGRDGARRTEVSTARHFGRGRILKEEFPPPTAHA